MAFYGSKRESPPAKAGGIWSLLKMARVFIPALLGLVLAGCVLQSVKHNPTTSALAANVFLRAMYVEHNYDRALMLSDPALRKSVTAANLAAMVELAERKCGTLQELKAESYLMTPGKTIELFYVGRCDRGILYHHLVLVGDVSDGYHVSGVWFQDSPYPVQTMRRQFETELVVR